MFLNHTNDRFCIDTNYGEATLPGDYCVTSRVLFCSSLIQKGEIVLGYPFIVKL